MTGVEIERKKMVVNKNEKTRKMIRKQDRE
jgi:hypothetical protein